MAPDAASARPATPARRLAGVLILLASTIVPSDTGAQAPSESRSAPETVDVAGIVVDAADGTPLVGASVTVGDTGLRTRTGAEGRFVLWGIPAGDHVWVIEQLGYARWEEPFEAEPLDQLTIRLMPRPVALEAISVSVDRLENRRKLAAVAAHSVSLEELRSSVATNAADLVQSRMPWPSSSCPV